MSHAQLSRPLTPESPNATRAQLTRMLDSLQRLQASAAPARKGKKSVSYVDQIATVKSRLTEGDFQIGDRILLDDGTKRDSVIVRDSLAISVGNWPSYSLHGVLRSELQGVVERYLSTYVRDPRMRVYPLTRLQFTGGFNHTGSLTVDPTRPLSDAFNQTGGTNVNAKKPDDVNIYRGDKRILDSKEIADALRTGETVDDLSLQNGDEIRGPAVKVSTFRMPPYQLVLLSVSVVTGIIAFIRASYVP